MTATKSRHAERWAGFHRLMLEIPLRMDASMDDDLRQAISEQIHLVPYSEHWPLRFRQEAVRLSELFPGRFVAIEHIGSTAVPGMMAKPIIDLMAGLPSLTAADAVLDGLCQHGYTTSAAFNATLSDSRWLMRQSGGHRTHHLHLVVHHGGKWQATLAFRDVLRKNPPIAEEYLRLKQALATCHGSDREAYTQAKSDFIRRVCP